MPDVRLAAAPDLAAPRRSVFADLSLSEGVTRVRPLPPSARFNFRGRGEVVDVAAAAFGVALPREACRADAAGTRAALWLGPDEWLLLADPEEGPAIEAKLAAALAGQRHSVVDVSHRNTAFALTGPGAAVALNAGCPLDLDISAFPAGMCTRTIFGKAELVLWRTDTERFHVEVWRSFAPYVTQYLEEVLAEQAAG
jgi:sarcosine oxidase, subunit gamma